MAIVSINTQDNDEIAALQQQLHILKELLKSSKQSQVNLQNTYNDKLKASEKAVQQANEALQEAQHAKQAALDEVAALYSQFDLIKARFLDADSRRQVIEKELTHYKNKEEEFNSQLSSSIAALNEAKTELSKFQKEAIEIKKHYEDILIENDLLKQSSEQAIKLQEDAENKLKIAHHHLAKKVRENAELSDKLENQMLKWHELTTQLEEAKETAKQFQVQLEQKGEKEKHTQSIMQQALASAEALANSWEEKYNELYKTLQQNNAMAAEKEKLEGKIREMTKLWTSMGELMNKDNPPSICEISKLQKPYQNLFDMSCRAQSVKHPFHGETL